MIDDALVFLKNQLNSYFKRIRGNDGAQPDPVDFISGDSIDPLIFKSGAVSVLLINLEEERALRPPDQYRRTVANGMQQEVQPEIRLNLFVLFVAHYAKYEQSLQSLSLIIRYFQNHRVFTHSDAPTLSDQIDRLVVELVTLPLAQQNDIWGVLRVPYHPSVLYQVKMVVFQDEEPVVPPVISETIIRIAS